MNKVQLEGVIKLIDVEIDPAIFAKISRITNGLPATFQKVGGQANSASSALNNVATSAQNINKQLSFGDAFATKFLQRMTQFAVLLPIFVTLNKAIQGGVKFLVDFESELINIQRIDPKNLTSRLGEIASTALDIGTNFGVSATEVVKSIRVFVQAGDSIEEAMNKAKVATLATQIGTIDLAQAQQLLINVNKQFHDQALTNIDIIDKLTKVSDESASDVKDVAEAFVTGGNAIAFATKSFDDAVGIISALREQTRKSGSEIGTFLKTISTRMLAAGASRSALEQLGVTVSDQAGRLRPLMDILKDTKAAFDGLTESEQANAAKAIAGARQFEGFLATLQSIDKAQDLAKDSANAQGESMKRLEVVQNKLSFQASKTVVEFEALAAALGEAGVLDFFKEAVKGAGALALALTQVVNVAKTIGVAVAPLLAIGALKLGQVAFGIGQNAIRSTLGIAGGGGAALAQQASRPGIIQPQGESTPVAALMNRDLTTSMQLRLAEEKKAAVLMRQESVARRDAITKFIAFTAFAAGLNSITKLLADNFKNLGLHAQSIANAAVNLTSSLSTGAQVAAAFGVKAGIQTAVFDLLIKTSIDLVAAFQEHNKAVQEMADMEKTAAAATGLAEAAAGKRGVGGINLTEQINKAFQSALGKTGGTTGGDFSRLVQAQLKTVLDGINPSKNPELKDIKSLNIADIFGNKQFLTAVGQADDSLKNLNKAISENAGVSQLFSAYAKDMADAARKAGLMIQEVADNFMSLDQIKAVDKLRDSEAQIAKILQERQEIARGDIPLFESEVSATKRRAEALKNFLDVGKATRGNLLDTARNSPGQFGIVGENASGRAEAFLNKLDNAFANAGKGGQFKLTEFLEDLSKVRTGNIEDADKALSQIGEDVQNIAPDNVDKLVEAARIYIEQKQKSAQAELEAAKATQDYTTALGKANVEASKLEQANLTEIIDGLNNAQLALLKLGVDSNASAADLDKVSKLTDKDFNNIINGTDSFDESIRNLIKTMGGTELQRAQENVRISNASFAKEMGNLNTKIKDTKTELAGVDSHGFNQATGKSSIQITEELNRLENQRRTLDLQGTQESIRNNLELLKARRDADISAINNARELKKAMDGLAESEFNLKNGTEDAAKSFKEFADSQHQSLLQEDAQAQAKLKEAEQGVLTSTKSLDDAYKNLRDSIISFNDTIANARIEVGLLGIQAKNLGGQSDNVAERLSSLNKIFGGAMKDANISLKERIDLEHKLADDSLAFLQKAQDQIVSAGLNVFGQNAQQNTQLAQGIAGLQFAADKLGGSFEKFSALSPQALDSIGKELLALPQNLRQNMLDALRTLPSTTKIGGFSPEQLQTALGQVGTGVSAQDGLPAIKDLIQQEKDQLQKIQDDTTKQADLQVSQLVAALQQVDNAKTQLEQSKIMEERAKEDAVEVRDKIIEQTAVLQAAADQREKLTTEILQATDSSTIRQIEAQARNFAASEPYYKDIVSKLEELVNSIGGLKNSQLNAQEGLQNLQASQQNSGAAGFVPEDTSLQNGAFGLIPNFAGGRLSPREVFGLIKAASREKYAMPPGAGLAVANTSEMIIPTRSEGFIPNFAIGNNPGNFMSPIAAGIEAAKGINQTVTAAIATAIGNSLNTLQTNVNGGNADVNRQTLEKLDKILGSLQELGITNSNISALLTAQNVPTTPTQQAGGAPTKIDVSVNGQSTVMVTGLENLKQTLTDAVKDARTKHDEKTLEPINQAIQQLFQALHERGVSSAFGGAR